MPEMTEAERKKPGPKPLPAEQKGKRVNLYLSPEATVYTCPTCGGSSHPSCGSQLSAGWVVCWRCTLQWARWARWVHRWTNSKGRRGGGPAFYGYMGKP